MTTSCLEKECQEKGNAFNLFRPVIVETALMLKKTKKDLRTRGEA